MISEFKRPSNTAREGASRLCSVNVLHIGRYYVKELWNVPSGNFFFFSSRRRHTRCYRDWSSDVCSSDLMIGIRDATVTGVQTCALPIDRKSTRLNSSHGSISYAVFCL